MKNVKSSLHLNAGVRVTVIALSVSLLAVGMTAVPATAAVSSSGTAIAWGSDGDGRLGAPSAADPSEAVAATGALAGKQVVAVSAGVRHSLALDSDGKVYGWGYNGAGQVNGVPNLLSPTVSSPSAVPGLGTVTFIAVAAGGSHSLALASDGTVWSWGDGSAGQLGRSIPSAAAAPVADLRATAIAAGGSHSLAIGTDGQVYAWGNNLNGQLGTGYAPATTPVRVPGLGSPGDVATSIAAGRDHSLAVVGGKVWGWGSNGSGQISDPTTEGGRRPVPVLASSSILNTGSYLAVAAGADHSLALRTDGTVVSFGRGAEGQLGRGSDVTSGAALVPGLGGVKSVTAGGDTSAALKLDGHLWTWGQGAAGQLGRTPLGISATPAQSKVERVIAVDLGDAHALAAVAPAIQLSTSSLAFPTTAPGAESPAQTVALRNTDARAPLIISSITTSDAAFRVAHSCATIAPGASCSLSLTFVPDAVRIYAGSLVVRSNAFDGDASASLSATAALPAGQVAVSTDVATVNATPTSATISDLPLQPRAPNAQTIGGIPSGSLGVIGGIPSGSLGVIGGIPSGSLGVIGGIPSGSLGVIGGIPSGSLGVIGGIPSGSLGVIPLVRSGLDQIKLADVPIPGGWERFKKGTAFELLPDQSVTLGDLLSASPPIATLSELTIADLVSAAATHESPLSAIPFYALLTGRTSARNIKLPASDPGWCARLEAQGFPQCGKDVSVNPPTASGPDGSLVDLALGGFDARTELTGSGALPLAGIRLGDISFASDAPLLQVKPSQITGLGDQGLGAVAVNAAVADCSRVTCGTATLFDAYKAGALRSTATLAGLVGTPGFDDLRLAEVGFGLLPAGLTPLELIGLERLGLLGTGPSRIAYTVRFTPTPGGAGLTRPTVSIQLPPGFTGVAGSSTATVAGAACACVADPTPSGDVLTGATFTWKLTKDVPAGANLALSFQARPGFTLGRFGVPAASVKDSATAFTFSLPGLSAPIEVTDPISANSDPGTATPIVTGQIRLAWIPTVGARRLFRIDVPSGSQQPGAIITAALDHLPADYDLRLLALPGQTAYEPAIRPVGDSLRIPTLADVKGGISDTSVALPPEDEFAAGVPLCLPQGGSCTPLTAVASALQRGTKDEVAQFVSPGGAGPFFIEVAGHNDAWSSRPAALRVSIAAPMSITGPARTFPYGWAPATSAPSTLPAGKTTVILTAWDRLAGIYGAPASASAASDVRALMSDPISGLRLNGVELQLDRLPAVVSKYQAWDADPTSPAKANDVIRAATNEVDRLVPGGLASIGQILIAGGDDIIPQARLLDPEIDGNERKFAAEMAAISGPTSSAAAALAAGRMLSDAPWGTAAASPLPGRYLYLESAGVSRLVENPAEIGLAARNARTLGLQLNPQRALVTGYDFLSDGAQRMQAALLSRLTTDHLISPPDANWNRDALVSRFNGASPRPDVVALNGHADPSRLLPPAAISAAGLYSTQDILNGVDLNGVVVASVGCHTGTLVPDSSATGATEFAQAIARKGGNLIGQTGYGMGSSVAVAYTEELVARYLELFPQLGVGRALVQAKAEYLAHAAVLDTNDEKVLQEMAVYGIGSLAWTNPTARPALDAAPALAADPLTGLSSATFDVTPQLTEQRTADGSYWKPAASATLADGRSLIGDQMVAAGRPIQPELIADVTAAGGLRAKGVVVEGLTDEERTGFDPVLARGIIDSAAHEAEPSFGDIVFPTQIAAVRRMGGVDGARDSLVVVPARFVSSGLVGRKPVGTERVYRSLRLRVLYSSDASTAPPVVRSATANVIGGAAVFSISADAAEGKGISGASVSYKDASGLWRRLVLTGNPATPGQLGGAAAVSGNEVEWFADVIGTNGVVTHASNKGGHFVARPPLASAGLVVAVDGVPAPANNGWYRSASVRLTGGEAIKVSVDGAASADYSGPVPITSDGVHSLSYTAIDPRTGGPIAGSLKVPVDGTAPTIVVTSPAPGTTVALGANLIARYRCADQTSGVGACTGSTADGAALNTSTAGAKALSVQATDGAGNIARTVAPYLVTFTFAGFDSPVSNEPVYNVVNAGSTVPIKWSLSNASGQPISDLNAVVSTTTYKISCETGTPESPAGTESTTVTGVTYNQSDGKYQDHYRFAATTAGTCQRYVLVLADQTVHYLRFRVT